MNNKVRGISFIILGLLPLILFLLILIISGISGTSDCLINLGPETNCHTIYGLEAIEMNFLLLSFIVVFYWYLSVPIILFCIFLIVMGIKSIRKGNIKNEKIKK